MTTVSDFIIPRFHPVMGDVMARGHTHYWLPGWRGSTKSSFIPIAIVLLVIANPKANAVVARRFSNTLLDSVYQRIQWAIEVLGLEGVFGCRVSSMEITYLPAGRRIVFRGADDPLKLKGVEFTRGIARWCGSRGWTSSRAWRRCVPFSILFAVVETSSGSSTAITRRRRCSRG